MPSTRPLSTRLLRILGRVQGVGYREAMRSEALSRACTGWVRNRTDGSVEALVCGEPEAVDALIAWAHRGPPAARVQQVIVRDMADAEAPTTGFERRPSA